MTRAERVSSVRYLRDRGLTPLEIAERLGISRVWVYELIHDPDGAGVKQRRERYRRACPSCGRKMDGSNGLGEAAPRLCIRCHETPQVFTDEELLAAIRECAAAIGRTPTAMHFSPALAEAKCSAVAAAAIRRLYEEHDWPSLHTFQTRFGSWSAALAAAGYAPRQVGRPRAAA